MKHMDQFSARSVRDQIASFSLILYYSFFSSCFYMSKIIVYAISLHYAYIYCSRKAT